ncbi:XdhC family protein [Rhodococcus sp. X156]|uniref:XdhC family protein n=1 Tax=Rhodococcus sp. X156 TaxID=2499145 RepID=UPI000FDBEC40|nr:XdhC family protein [Rhodococcus sp. X156]
MAELVDLGAALTRWRLNDTPVCVVRVSEVHGFGATAPTQLLLSDGAELHGSLLSGAADEQARGLAAQVLADGVARQAEVAVDESNAARSGLACAGRATLHAHLLPDAAAELVADGFLAGSPVALLSAPAGLVVTAGRDAEQVSTELDDPEPALAAVRGLLRLGRSCTETVELTDGGQALVDVLVPRSRLVLVGGGALADALGAQARLLDWDVLVRTGVAETEQTVAGLTAADAVVVLDHDPAFDGALLRTARGPGFAGALGSRHAQAARRERLLGAGATEEELARIHGPVGLDLGARTPAETAVSVVAEIISVRSGRAPRALSATTGRIKA